MSVKYPIDTLDHFMDAPRDVVSHIVSTMDKLEYGTVILGMLKQKKLTRKLLHLTERQLERIVSVRWLSDWTLFKRIARPFIDDVRVLAVGFFLAQITFDSLYLFNKDFPDTYVWYRPQGRINQQWIYKYRDDTRAGNPIVPDALKRIHFGNDAAWLNSIAPGLYDTIMEANQGDDYDLFQVYPLYLASLIRSGWNQFQIRNTFQGTTEIFSKIGTECANCASHAPKRACGQKCGTLYCNQNCADAHWNEHHEQCNQ